MSSCVLSVAEGAFKVGIMEIWEQQPRDIEAIDATDRAAFATQAEADVVNGLRTAGALLLSFVVTEKV